MYYSYCLNNNIRGIANYISKKPGLVVNELFNVNDRKFRKRNVYSCRNKHSVSEMTSRLENCLRE